MPVSARTGSRPGRPVKISVKGTTVAYSAIGIVTNNLARHRAGRNKPGQIAYRFDSDFAEVTKRLAKTEAGYRMLSIHYGIERNVRVDARQIKDWRKHAVERKGLDLIIGHHAHVARPVEVNGNAVIFYGLGNFLHHGTANMAKQGKCRDYGLVARVHLLRGQGGRLITRAVEVLPVTNTHHRTKPFAKVADAHLRIAALNYLAADLDDQASGHRGTRFTPQKNGSGLYCMPGAGKDPGRIGELCRGWKPASAPGSAVRARLRKSCGPVKRSAARTKRVKHQDQGVKHQDQEDQSALNRRGRACRRWPVRQPDSSRLSDARG